MKPEEAIDVLKRMRIALATANVDGIRVLEPLNIAIQALERQVAKKPVMATSAPSYVLGKKVYTEYKACGVCGDVVGGGCAEKSNYCSVCGNKVDWSVEE